VSECGRALNKLRLKNNIIAEIAASFLFHEFLLKKVGEKSKFTVFFVQNNA
jgi:hypothetical protein